MLQAYHRLIMPDGTEHSMVAVELDADGRLVSFHTLQGEEPFVEWKGGVLRLTDEALT